MPKIRAGDGSAPKPMRWWEVLYRTVFGTEHAGRRYVVEVRLLADDVRLFVDGAQTARSSLPVTFPVDGGAIEVAAATYGLKRMHLLPDDGETRQLEPARGTAERWRADLDRRRPRLSRWMARAAVLVLLVGLGVAVPAVLEWASHLEVVAERFGTFTSPLDLPGWLGVALTVAGVLAGIERALMLRNHWLIDLDTYWIG